MFRMIGNFDIAEEVVQDSLIAALEKWPEQGIPDRPGAWLLTTARRRAIDLLRRDHRYAEKVALLERSPSQAVRLSGRQNAHALVVGELPETTISHWSGFESRASHRT